MKKEKSKNISFVWWILGLVLPPLGIVLYFMNRKKDKVKSKQLISGSIIGLLIYLLVFVVLSSKLPEDNRNLNSWRTDINKGEYVVTVIGASYCSHCQEYKPVIKALANKYGFNLYFYESDILSDDEQSILYDTFELPDFEGYVPYTIIFKDGKPLKTTTGFANKDTTIEFLKENGVIKN